MDSNEGVNNENIDDLLAKSLINKPTDLEKAGLKGAIKQIKEYKYKAFKKDDRTYLGKEDLFENGSYYTTTNYNEQGGKVETLAHERDGRVTKTTYSDDGRILECRKELWQGVPHELLTYTYNDKNLLIKEEQFFGKETVAGSRKEYQYDENDHLLEVSHLNSNDAIFDRYRYRYNKKGFKIEFRRTYGAENFAQWETYKNNARGNITEISYLNEDGSLRHKKVQTDLYDVNGDKKKPAGGDEPPNIPFQFSSAQTDKHGNVTIKLNYYRSIPVNANINVITYYGEEPIPHPVHGHNHFFQLPVDLIDPKIVKWDEKMEEKKPTEEKNSRGPLSMEDAKWFADKGGLGDAFPFVAYYLHKFKEYPSQCTFSGQTIDALALLKELEQNVEAKIVHCFEVFQDDFGDGEIARYTLTFPEYPGYLVHASQIYKIDGEAYAIPAFIDEHHGEEGQIHTSQIVMLRPGNMSESRDETGIEKTIKEYIQKCKIERKIDKPEIYMVEVMNDKFSLQSHAIKEDFEIEDLDIQYGYGFEKFHQDLMDRFTSENKGLVLFHGLPGTGKTYYIRHLLKEMAEANKVVIYMPPNMVDHLVEPGFMTFLSKTVVEYSSEGQFCVLLIEDAEPLLASRSSDTRIQGVTNLLNMTDGLLNDMLKLQIICTFNVELKQLDAALLRPGRLIARKEFKALPELDANLLAQRLGIKHHFTEPATLSEIYALLKDKNTLIHDEY